MMRLITTPIVTTAVIAIFLLLTVAGCTVEAPTGEARGAGPGEVSSSQQVDRQGQMPQTAMATYSWLEDSEPSSDLRVNNPRIDALVKRAVEDRLQSMGFAKAGAADKPDYLLAWFGTIEEEVKDISLASFYSRSGYTGLLGNMPEEMKDGTVQKTFSRGTLVIDVLDSADKKVLWRGNATNTLRSKMSEKQLAEYIDASVAHIFKSLPAKKQDD